MTKMSETLYHGRRAVTVENEHLRVSVLVGGGHIAEIFEKSAGVNPLWVPPWRSVEPVDFDRSMPGDYGHGSDNRLLAAIMGHNLCLDIFGGPSDEEAAAGLTPHGEGSVVAYEITESGRALCMRADFPLAQINFERRLELNGRAIQVEERVESR